MNLELRPIPAPTSPGYWEPFDSFDGFTQRWWEHAHSTDAHYISATRDGEEVARLQLDNDVYIDAYVDLPDIAEPPLEIQLIEVHTNHQRRGIATACIAALATAHPTERLVAFSEEADHFWDTLGWTRHTHKDDDGIAPPHRPLYIQK